MNNQLVVNENVWESKELVAEIRKAYAPNLNEIEFKMFCEMGRATGLSPFLREIWAIKYTMKNGETKTQIFIGRDGYRKAAQRSPYYDYHQSDAVYSNDDFRVEQGIVNHKYNLKDRGTLIGAYAIMQRKGASKPIFVYVPLSEYKQAKPIWNEKESTMIKKVAECQVLRMGNQEVLGGTYSEYETIEDREPEAREHKGINGVKEALGIAQPEEVNVTDAEIVDDEIPASLRDETPEEPTELNKIINKINEATTLQELQTAVSNVDKLSPLEKTQARGVYAAKSKKLKAQQKAA